MHLILALTRGLSLATALVLMAGPAQALSQPSPACLAGSSSQQSPDGAVELCGTTTIRASGAGYVRIIIPREVKVDPSFGPGGAIEIEGDGPFVGFVLTEDRPDRDGRLLVAGHLDRQPVPHKLYQTFGGVSDPAFDGTFPPGQYLLYVLASGSPVAVTLRLAELSGSAELEPTAPTGFDVRSLEPRIYEQSGRLVYTTGAEGHVAANGLMLTSVWVRTAQHALGRYGTCMYQGSVPEYGFVPECPEGRSFGFTPVQPPTSDFNPTVTTVFRGWPASTYGLGSWYQSAAQVTAAGAVVFWLDLE